MGTLLLAAVVSCRKFLDVTPKGYLVAAKTSDYSNLLNSGPTAGGLEFMIPMGDDVVAVDPAFASADFRTQRLFRWADTIYNADEDDALLTSLGAGSELYPLNKVIAEVMNSQGGTEAEKKSVQGEARGVRAWLYFQFVNLYGRPYNESTAADDPAYPIMTAADVTQNSFVRASVKDVYDFIIADLNAAIRDAPAAIYTASRMSRSAAEMLLGKVYMFMGKYDQALVQLNAAFSHIPERTNFTALGLADYNVQLSLNGPWGYTATTPSFWFFTSPTYNPEDLFLRTMFHRYTYLASDILVSPEVVASYHASDQRLKFLGGQIGTNLPFLAPGALRRVGFMLMNAGLNLADLYLLRAECRARTNDLTGAVADLQALRLKRMSAADAGVPALSQKDLIRFIFEERRREFVMRGYRWLDMRRMYNDPVFSGTEFTHKYYKADGSTETIRLKPDRLTLRLPEKVINQNPGMKNNP